MKIYKNFTCNDELFFLLFIVDTGLFRAGRYNVESVFVNFFAFVLFKIPVSKFFNK